MNDNDSDFKKLDVERERLAGEVLRIGASVFPVMARRSLAMIDSSFKHEFDNLSAFIRKHYRELHTLLSYDDIRDGIDSFNMIQRNLIMPLSSEDKKSYITKPYQYCSILFDNNNASSMHRIICMATVECFRKIMLTSLNFDNDYIADTVNPILMTMDGKDEPVQSFFKEYEDMIALVFRQIQDDILVNDYPVEFASERAVINREAMAKPIIRRFKKNAREWRESRENHGLRRDGLSC